MLTSQESDSDAQINRNATQNYTNTHNQEMND